MYRTGDFTSAKEIFENLADEFCDKTSKVMLERCELLLNEPPAEWKGVWKMDTK